MFTNNSVTASTASLLRCGCLLMDGPTSSTTTWYCKSKSRTRAETVGGTVRCTRRWTFRRGQVFE